ncbi:MAG TPA: tetratricopeptide repeat protein [Aridibacter sp.]|nr:tetratricopeptide repeat protein [Aridibacter sp.]
MDLRSQLRKSLLTVAVLWAFLLSSVPVNSQVIVPGNIAGGSTKYVITGQKKKGSFTTRRSSQAKRTIKQRSSTRRQVVRQSQAVAKTNRNRRDIDEVTPEEYRRLEVQIKRMPKEEASKVLAGAGEYFVTRDEVDNAVTYLEGAVELDPENTDAKLALSEVYTSLGDRALVKADEFLDLSAKASAANDKTNERRNSALANTETEKAERYYQAAVQYDPNNPSAYVGLGQFYDAKGRDDLARENYEKALALDNGLTEVKGPLGIIYFKDGEVAKAEQLIADSLASDPNNAESQFFLGLIRYKQNQNEEALAALKRSIEIDNENAESHYYLGATLNRLGNEDQAIAEFERSVGLDQRFYQAWFDLGVAYYNKGEYDKAIAAFEKSIEFNSDQTDEQKRLLDEGYANVAEAYRQSGKIDLAIAKYRIAVARVKDDPELYTTYGFAQAERGIWVPAIDAFKTASGLAPDTATVTTNLGWAHYKAAEDYERKNMQADKRSHLASARTALERALSQYNRSDNASRENLAAANLYLGVVLSQLGEPDRAAEALKEANRLSNEKWAAAVFELGKAEYNRKRWSDAIKQFKRAMKIQENFPEAMYYLALSEFRNGDQKEARKVQEQLKSVNPALAGRLEREFFRIDFN